MKYLIILLVIFLSSCNNDDIKVKNPETITTLEIKNLADKDSSLYKAVYLKGTMYFYNIRTNKVDISIDNLTGDIKGLGLVIVVLFILCIVFACITCVLKNS